MEKKRLVPGKIKTKTNTDGGGYFIIADFNPPPGEKQMNVAQSAELMNATQLAIRYQMFTEKEADQIHEICVNAAVRCGFLKEV